jgi:leader peptidase (prepilin peptidase) / N-methyltransferase
MRARSSAAVPGGQWRRLGIAVLCGLGTALFIWILMIIYPKGMGDGDVRLCLMLGLATGWFNWQTALVGTMAGFVLGSVVGIGYGIASRQYLKAQLPFGPWLGLGALLLVWFAK